MSATFHNAKYQKWSKNPPHCAILNSYLGSSAGKLALKKRCTHLWQLFIIQKKIFWKIWLWIHVIRGWFSEMELQTEAFSGCILPVPWIDWAALGHFLHQHGNNKTDLPWRWVWVSPGRITASPPEVILGLYIALTCMFSLHNGNLWKASTSLSLLSSLWAL